VPRLLDLVIPVAGKTFNHKTLEALGNARATEVLERLIHHVKKEDQIRYMGEHRQWYTPIKKHEKPSKLYFVHKYNSETGLREGPSTEYWPNGEISSIVFYKNGVMHGDAKYFSQRGELRLHAMYNNGSREGRQQEWFRTGKQHSDYTCKDGVKHGPCHMLFKKGFSEFEYYFENGKLHGEQKEFHRTSKLYLHNCFEHGKREGFWNTWYETGDKSVESNFHNDMLEGVRKKWNKAGTMLAWESYHEDKKHGECKEWSAYGNLTDHKMYDNGTVVEDYLRPKGMWANHF